jgi:uncharacterized membrane protein
MAAGQTGPMATAPAALEKESRWLAVTCIAVAAVLQFHLPEKLTVGPSALMPVVTAGILGVLLVANPKGISALARDVRALSIALVALINISNVASLGLLLHQLLNTSKLSGRTLIFSAVEIWLTSVIVYALWLWELDRGGPRARVRGVKVDPDLLFPQMTDPSLTSTPWRPSFVDYLYVSLTNSTAFSPTDTLPLTTRMKAILAAESLTSLATIAVVGARAVNILR